MAHDVRTARNVYDYLGVTHHNERIGGIGSIMLQRQERVGSTSSSTSSDTDSSEWPPPSQMPADTRGPGAAGASIEHPPPPPAPLPLATAHQPARHAARQLEPLPGSATASHRNRRTQTRWTAVEEQLLSTAAADRTHRRIHYSAEQLYKSKSFRSGMARMTRDQVYEKFKTLRSMQDKKQASSQEQ